VSATDYLAWGMVAHVVADWLLQNDWMARNKASLRHPAAWVHSSIHGAALALVFPWPAAAGLAIAHLLIDTRRPLALWRRFFRQTEEGRIALHVALWGDQVAHVAAIAAAALLLARSGL